VSSLVLKARVRRRNIPTGPTKCHTIHGYTDRNLLAAISELRTTLIQQEGSGWERKRLAALEEERENRGLPDGREEA
jgi:hypothetical protein